MILLLSEDGDLSSDYLEDWLVFYRADYMRINAAELIFKPIDINISEHTAYTHLLSKDIPFNQIKVIWNRRWNPLQNLGNWVMSMKLESPLQYTLTNSLRHETRIISNHFLKLFPNAFWVDTPASISTDKLSQLKAALDVGLLIPPTLVTSNKQSLLNFLEEHKEIISKPLSEIVSFKTDSDLLLTYTGKVDDNVIQSLGEYFFPSLFQKRIIKKLEIRTFFLDDKLFPMAIFSQSNEQTQVDFRRYDHVKPNRNAPITLEKEIISQIILLMKKLDLKTGSIDLILSEDNKIYFLEVNPVGQYDMVSKPCNYSLDKEIALFLIKLNQNEEQKHSA